jgi:hypothetical protein
MLRLDPSDHAVGLAELVRQIFTNALIAARAIFDQFVQIR